MGNVLAKVNEATVLPMGLTNRQGQIYVLNDTGRNEAGFIAKAISSDVFTCIAVSSGAIQTVGMAFHVGGVITNSALAASVGLGVLITGLSVPVVITAAILVVGGIANVCSYKL